MRVRGFDLVRLALLGTVACAAYGVCDLIFSWNPIAAAPYLAQRSLAVFRPEPRLDVGFVAEILNGWMLTAVYLSLESSLGSRWTIRGLKLGLIVAAFWVVSGTLTVAVWLSVPASLLVTNIVFGVAKCLGIGWIVSGWAQRFPVRQASSDSR